MEKTELGYWRTFERVTDPNDKSVKELIKLTKREPQKWWFPMGKGVREMLLEGPIHLFVNQEDKPVICITMKNDRLHEIMGRGDGRTVEDLYKRTLDEFIRKDRKLAVQVEQLQREVEAKGLKNLTEEEKTVATKGEYDFGIMARQANEKKPTGGGLIGGFGFAPVNNAPQKVTSTEKKETMTVDMLIKEIEEKIRTIKDKEEQAKQRLERDEKAAQVIQLSAAFATGRPLSPQQLNLTLQLLKDGLVSKMVSNSMNLDVFTQLDAYIRTPQAKAMEGSDPAFKAHVQNFMSMRDKLFVMVNARDNQNQSEQNQQPVQADNQLPPRNQPPNQPSGPNQPPRSNVPPSTPPGTPPPPPPNTLQGPTLRPMPRPQNRTAAPVAPSQVFQQGIQEALEEGLVEPEAAQTVYGERKGKSEIKPNTHAVKDEQGKAAKK